MSDYTRWLKDKPEKFVLTPFKDIKGHGAYFYRVDSSGYPFATNLAKSVVYHSYNKQKELFQNAKGLMNDEENYIFSKKPLIHFIQEVMFLGETVPQTEVSSNKINHLFKRDNIFIGDGNREEVSLKNVLFSFYNTSKDIRIKAVSQENQVELEFYGIVDRVYIIETEKFNEITFYLMKKGESKMFEEKFIIYKDEDNTSLEKAVMNFHDTMDISDKLNPSKDKTEIGIEFKDYFEKEFYRKDIFTETYYSELVHYANLDNETSIALYAWTGDSGEKYNEILASLRIIVDEMRFDVNPELGTSIRFSGYKTPDGDNYTSYTLDWADILYYDIEEWEKYRILKVLTSTNMHSSKGNNTVLCFVLPKDEDLVESKCGQHKEFASFDIMEKMGYRHSLASFKVANPSKTTPIKVSNKKISNKENIKGEKEMKNFKDRFSTLMPKKLDGAFAFTLNGSIAVKNADGDYVSYNPKTKQVENSMDLVFGEDKVADYTFVMPVASDTLKVGDIVLSNGDFHYVDSIDKESKAVSYVNLSGAVKSEVVPVKNLLTNTTMVSKVFTLFDGSVFGDAKGGFNPMMFMLMDKDGGNGDMFKLMLMSQMMGGEQSNAINPMMFLLMK